MKEQVFSFNKIIKMLIKSIKIKNIRSYKEGEVIFPEGSTLLMGDIGSGKTSILLAIEFALFGLQPSQKGNSILRNNENEAGVVLELVVDDNQVIIERALKKSGKSISQTDCAITINNERFEGSVTEVKNKILALLNYPQEFAKKTNDLYKFTVYTPQEEMKQIIQESGDTRLNTLRHVFGIDKYKRIEENIEILTTKLRQEIKLKEGEIGNIEIKKQMLADKNQLLQTENSKLIEVESEILEIQKIKQEKEQEIQQLREKIDEKNRLKNEFEKSELTLGNKRDMIYNFDKEISSIKEQIKNKEQIKYREEDAEIFKTRVRSQEQIQKDLNDQYIITVTNIQNNESKLKELKTLIEKISGLEKCPTCLQCVAEEYKQNIVIKARDEHSRLDNETQKLKKDKQELTIKLEQTKRQIDTLKNSISEMQIIKIRLENLNEKEKRMLLLEKQKSTILADIELIKNHMKDLEQLMKDYEVYETNFQLKNRDFLDIQGKERQAMIKKAETNRGIQFLNTQIKEIENEIRKIEQLTIKLNYLKELEFWLNGKFIELVLYTEKNVMLKLREEFSELFSNWFSILVPETLSVKLDESFSPIIQQQDYELDYSYLSGGERTAVALAYRLALNQVINSILSTIKTRDLVILDEPTDGFSEAQLDKIRDILLQLKVKQLIIVSHEQKVEGFVDNIIRFRKVNGVTEIVKE
jgi:exonuclease SbcC